MIRKFKFEDEMHESLQCVPMAVRRKLDRVGLKIGLEQWKSLDHGERLAICHLPVDSSEELNALGVFIREAMKRRLGVEPKSPDFLRLAESLGCHASRAASAEHLAQSVRGALVADRPTLIEVRQDSPWLRP